MRRPSAVPATSHTQRDVEVMDGMRLRYIDVGNDEGRPPLVLIHGLASDGEAMAPEAAPGVEGR